MKEGQNYIFDISYYIFELPRLSGSESHTLEIFHRTGPFNYERKRFLLWTSSWSLLSTNNQQAEYERTRTRQVQVSSLSGCFPCAWRETGDAQCALPPPGVSNAGPHPSCFISISWTRSSQFSGNKSNILPAHISLILLIFKPIKYIFFTVKYMEHFERVWKSLIINH